MTDENKVDPQQAPCACGPSCDCGPSSAGSWMKTIIAAIILLAAVGVGAYSLFAKRTATAGAAPATSAGPAVPTAAQPTPTAGHAPCCAGQASTEAPAKPRCCAGGGGAPATTSAAQPSCGGSRPACCGGH